MLASENATQRGFDVGGLPGCRCRDVVVASGRVGPPRPPADPHCSGVRPGRRRQVARLAMLDQPRRRCRHTGCDETGMGAGAAADYLTIRVQRHLTEYGRRSGRYAVTGGTVESRFRQRSRHRPCSIARGMGYRAGARRIGSMECVGCGSAAVSERSE